MTKRALITGINGFVGPYLKATLEAQGWQVYGIDRNPSHSDEEKIFTADILDRKSLEEVVRIVRPDWVFHLAGQSSVTKSFTDPDSTRAINVGGTENLYNAIKKTAPTGKVLLVSSCQVYGNPKHNPVREEDLSHQATSPYAASRLEQEQVVAAFPEISSIIMRAFNHIGPNQNPEFVLSGFARQIAALKKSGHHGMIQAGNLEAIRDFSDVRDITRGYALATTKGKTGKIYNIGSGQGYKLHDLLVQMLEIAQVKAEIVIEPAKLRPTDIPALVCDHSRFSDDTGWQPEYNIAASLRDLLRFWEEKTP